MPIDRDPLDYGESEDPWTGARPSDGASEPASVYPAAQGWVVAPPGTAEDVRFDGPNARDHALRYAYEAFGGARFFPF